MHNRKKMLVTLCLLLELLLLACGQEENADSTTESSVDTPSTVWTEADTTESLPATTETEPMVTETEEQTVTTPPTVDTEPWVTEPAPPITETTAPPETEPPPPPPYYYVDGYEYRIDITPYRSYIDPTNAEDYWILANRLHPLPEGYVPSDLIRIDSSRSLRKAAYYAWKAMSQEMAALGVLDTWAQSTYRSEELQQYLYQKYLEEERLLHPNYTEEQLVALVDSYSARPGTSDHQTGLAIDFSPISSRFERYRAYAYLLDNAHKFGFILRFPKGRTDVTGYMFESWHWRFVGRTTATEIYERNLTLEEYLDEKFGGILNPIPPETDPPETDPPETDPPETDPPETDPPETDPLETSQDFENTTAFETTHT